MFVNVFVCGVRCRAVFAQRRLGSHGTGHHVAVALNKAANSWFLFDDSHVAAVAGADVPSPTNTQLLFYLRRGV